MTEVFTAETTIGSVIRSAIRRADRGQLDAFAATFAAE
jgi:hypothetical protein